MSEDFSQTQGKHRHGPGCGHTAIQHNDHVDYLNEKGFLEHPGKDGTVAKHVLEENSKNPTACKPTSGASKEHVHGTACGHEKILHADHIDYIVNGKLEHPHGSHTDDHGPITVVPA